MAAAVLATVVLIIDAGAITTTGWIVLGAGSPRRGSGAGSYAARTVQMTAMPQLVSLFNAVGGGAAALLAVSRPGAGRRASCRHGSPCPAALDILIGAVTFTGSLVAAGKLQGVVPGRPIVFRRRPAANVVIGARIRGRRRSGWSPIRAAVRPCCSCSPPRWRSA